LKWGENSLRPLFLLVKILDVFLAYFTLRFTSYANFFPFLKDLQKREQIDQMIISGEPFYLFKVGYLAFKKLGMRWIADYRDDWSTNEIQRQKKGGFLRSIVFKIESYYEKKWIKSASHIISVSELYTKRISDFIDVPGTTVANGFEEELLDLPSLPLFVEFTVVYNGTLYPSQNIQIILDTLDMLTKVDKPFHLVFLGSGFDVKERIRIESMIGYNIKSFVKVTGRLPREEALRFIQKSHVVLGISYGNLKGIPSSKLYEYIGLKKPVLLCPTDNDVMENILKDVELGYFAYDSDTCFQEIEKIRKLYERGEVNSLAEGVGNKALKYSRLHQMLKIKSLLN
jgi:glycosyltransferase involved in cell wall biosynthesis